MSSTPMWILAVLNVGFWLFNIRNGNDGVAVFNLVVACFLVFMAKLTDLNNKEDRR